MLSFVDTAVQDLKSEDGLAVFSRGLPVSKVIVKLVSSIFRNSSHGLNPRKTLPLVLTLNIPPNCFLAKILKTEITVPENCTALPRVITSDYSARERAQVYSQGGLLVVTSRILIHDLLTTTLDPGHIDGFIVHRAHQISSHGLDSDSTPEAFILRLFRERNKTGFIKAFSDQPQALTAGRFHHCEKVMRALYVKRLFLWPRFRDLVVDALDAHPLDVIELIQPLTMCVNTIQNAIIQTIRECLEELKLSTKNGIDLSDILVIENALAKNFQEIVRNQLQPVWHDTSVKTRQLILDLGVLQKLLTLLLNYNCVDFYRFLEYLRANEGPKTVWIMLPCAQPIFKLAQARVYRTLTEKRAITTKAKKRKLKKEILQGQDATIAAPLERKEVISVLEENPKWSLLSDILKEIEDSLKADTRGKAEFGRVLITVHDERTRIFIEESLHMGAKQTLTRLFKKYAKTRGFEISEIQRNRDPKENVLEQLKARDLESHPESDSDDDNNCGTQLVPDQDFFRLHGRFRDKNFGAKQQHLKTRESSKQNEAGLSIVVDVTESESDLDSFDSEVDQDSDTKKRKLPDYSNENADPLAKRTKISSKIGSELDILIYPLDAYNDGEGSRILEEFSPSFIVMYEPDLTFLREAEVFKASHPGRPVRLYLLCYENSVEEQKFRNAVDREQQTFEILIREKATMVIHEDQEGRREAIKNEFTASGESRLGKFLGEDKDSRTASLSRARESKKIIVDMRDLRSSLPALLYVHGMQIIPATLSVGDFILSPRICVERKSLSDLHGSFNSGRLFNQMENMSRNYTCSCLLIELDPNRPLSLISRAELSDMGNQISPTSIVSKMVLLTQRFPMIRLLWCRGSRETANIFAALKRNEEEPDEETAVRIGTEEDCVVDQNGQDLNLEPYNMLKILPGIDRFNIQKVIDSVESISELLNLSLEEMTSLLGTKNGNMLYKFSNAIA